MDFNNFKFFGTFACSPVRVQILEANKMFSQKKKCFERKCLLRATIY